MGLLRSLADAASRDKESHHSTGAPSRGLTAAVTARRTVSTPTPAISTSLPMVQPASLAIGRVSSMPEQGQGRRAHEVSAAAAARAEGASGAVVSIDGAAPNRREGPQAQGAELHALPRVGPPQQLQSCLKGAKARAATSAHELPPTGQPQPVLPARTEHSSSKQPHATAGTPAILASAASAQGGQAARSSWHAAAGKGASLHSGIRQVAASAETESMSVPLRQQQQQKQRSGACARLEAERAWGKWEQGQQRKSGLRSGKEQGEGDLHSQHMQQLGSCIQGLLHQQERLELCILSSSDHPSAADIQSLVGVKRRLAELEGLRWREQEKQKRLQHVDGEQQQQQQHRRHRYEGVLGRLELPEGFERARKSRRPTAPDASPSSSLSLAGSGSCSLSGGMSPSDGTVHPRDPSPPASHHAIRNSWPSYTAAATAYAALAAQLSSQVSQPPPVISAVAQVGAQPRSGSSVPLPAVPLQHAISASSSVLSSSSDVVPPRDCSPSARVFRGLVLPRPACQTAKVHSSKELTAHLTKVRGRYNRL